jgi:signal transduction histidine kinase
VRNAVVHHRPDGAIWIRIFAREITIENTGTDISSVRLMDALAPFRRGARDRTTDSGSGLTIATSAADAHHAFLELAARSSGGVHACLRFPA